MRGIICADNMDILASVPNDTLDLIVTDPPYGWEFMSREWDRTVPSVEAWREHLRVLKPGAFAFVMSGPRMDGLSEMGKRLAEAGFETGISCLFWTYASGFPKAQNIGKAVDKRLGAERQIISVEKRAGGAINTYSGGRDNTRPWQDRQVEQYGYLVNIKTSGPATPQAQALDGSYAGFQPKPAVEVVIVAMKPLAHGTYVDQVLDNGKGATWLDDCRIPFQMDKETRARGANTLQYTNGIGFQGTRKGSQSGNPLFKLDAGRFPANLLVSDDALDDGHVHASGKMIRSSDGRKDGWNVYGAYGEMDIETIGDSGSFSRFFDLDSWWRERLKKLPPGVQNTYPFLITPKAARNEKWFICRVCDEVCPGSRPARHRGHEFHCNDCGVDFQQEEREDHQGHDVVPNFFFHPTQKPIDLMTYLIVLGSRKGDLVGDFYCGTGTVGWSAMVSGRNYILVDSDRDSVRIAAARLNHLASLMKRRG